MIRINLLPVRAAKKKQAGRQQLLLMMLIIAGVVVFMLFWIGVETAERRKQEARVADMTKEIQQLEQIIGEVKQYSETKAMLESKLKIIEDLKKGRVGPVKVLDELAQKIPKRVWLNKMIEKSGGITFVGQAATDEDIAAFMQDLQKSQFFTDISLKFTRIGEREGMKIKQFELTCRVNYAA
jgi:type IV pilus assembly protein PilN